MAIFFHGKEKLFFVLFVSFVVRGFYAFCDSLLGQASDQRGNKHDENQYHGNLCQLALLLGREWFAVTFCHFDDHEQGDEQNN